jgi:hypothetical protein
MTYTRTNLQDQIFDSTSQANIGSAITLQDLLNRVVRRVYGDVDLRTAKRKTQISPGLFKDVFTYPWPSDAKGLGLIDVDPQVNRSSDFELYLTTPEEFQRRKSIEYNLAAIRENDFVKKLLLNVNVDDDSLSISTLDSIETGGGTWQAFGDAENVTADADDYVMGVGSIKFGINAAGGTTAGIYNDDLDEFDFSDYVDNNRSIFYFTKITNTTNITNYKIRIGSSASNYYEITATVTQEGIAFQNGWNLLRFDFSAKTTTGTPDATAGKYVAIYMTKAVGKVSETDYRFDHIIMRGGVIHDLYYYTKYGWQSNTGTYKENSTANTDYVNADTDELELFTYAGKVEAALELRHFNLAEVWEKRYQSKKAEYQLKYPSEAKLLTQIIYEL